MKNSTEKKVLNWKSWVVIIFTVGAVSGMMYMLFTDEKYNQFANLEGSIPATDTATKATTTVDNNTSTEDPAATAKKQPEKVTPTTTAEETKPVIKTEPVAQAPVKPIEKPVVEENVVTKTQPAAKAPIASAPAQKPDPLSGTGGIKPLKAPAYMLQAAAREDKILTDAELQQLANSIAEKSSSAGIASKCIQLRNTADGNNKATIRQIESYLRGQKYSIAGRLTISTKVKGLQVEAGDGCMKLTVGSF